MKKLLKKLSGTTKKQEKYQDIPEDEEDDYEDDYDEEEEVTEVLETENGDEWIAEEYEEGQLSIDVYQTNSDIVVQSTIAGVRPEDIDISINNDMLTIKGKRHMNKKIKEDDYLYRECYWGSFSRSIILPVEVQAEKIDATLENGVLTVVLPKAKVSKQISIKVKER